MDLDPGQTGGGFRITRGVSAELFVQIRVPLVADIKTPLGNIRTSWLCLNIPLIVGCVVGAAVLLLGFGYYRFRKAKAARAGTHTAAMSEIGGSIVVSINPVSTDAQVGHMHLPTHEQLHSETLSTPQPVVTTLVQPSGDEKSLGEKIKEISELKDQGILTEEEFSAAKAKLIDQEEFESSVAILNVPGQGGATPVGDKVNIVTGAVVI
jgi:hypothetical protein